MSSVQLGDDLDLGSPSTLGRLDIYRTAANTPAVTLDGAASSISTFGSDGLEQIRLHGTSYGELLLRNSLPNNATTVRLTAQGTTGGQLELRNTNGSNRAVLDGENTGGTLTLYQTDGQTGVFLDGDDGGAGIITIRSTNGSTRVTLDGYNTSNGGGEISVFNSVGDEGVEIVAGSAGGAISVKNENNQLTAYIASSSTGGYQYLYNGDGDIAIQLDGDNGGAGLVSVRNTNGSSRVILDGYNTSGSGKISVYGGTGAETIYLLGSDSTGAGGEIVLKQANGTATIEIDGEVGTGGGGWIQVRDGAGAAAITLDAVSGTEARLTVAGTVSGRVVEITGGSDLSEKFDIAGEKDEVLPGMLVCIDPENPGRLIPSRRAYDRTAAGVISGAGGVLPGMLMGQRGTVADGKHPVALTGRVYCWVDADAGGPVQPGDMITTSDTPGHGMKVSDFNRSHGSTIGKAMTSLKSGKGLVLVLVSLQ